MARSFRSLEFLEVDLSSCRPKAGNESPKLSDRANELYCSYASAWEQYRSFVSKCDQSHNGLLRMQYAVDAVTWRKQAEAIGRAIVRELPSISHVAGSQEILLQSCWQASLEKDNGMREALLRLKHPSMRATQLMHQQASSRCHGALFATTMPSIQEDETKLELPPKPNSC